MFFSTHFQMTQTKIPPLYLSISPSFYLDHILPFPARPTRCAQHVAPSFASQLGFLPLRHGKTHSIQHQACCQGGGDPRNIVRRRDFHQIQTHQMRAGDQQPQEVLEGSSFPRGNMWQPHMDPIWWFIAGKRYGISMDFRLYMDLYGKMI